MKIKRCRKDKMLNDLKCLFSYFLIDSGYALYIIIELNNMIRLAGLHPYIFLKIFSPQPKNLPAYDVYNSEWLIYEAVNLND